MTTLIVCSLVQCQTTNGAPSCTAGRTTPQTPFTMSVYSTRATAFTDRGASGTNLRTPKPRWSPPGMESEMAQWDQKVRIVLGTFSLELPASLVKQEGNPVDSMAAVFEGSGLFVIATQGPYSDQLTSYVGRPDYKEEKLKIGGLPARMVSFKTPEEGTYTVAVHVPELNGLTVLVRSAESVPQQVARDIVQSVEPVK